MDDLPGRVQTGPRPGLRRRPAGCIPSGPRPRRGGARDGGSSLGDIFREIEEDLRQEKAERLWRRYGKYVIGGAVAVVLAVAGYGGWQQYRENRQLEDGARFAAAVALVAEDRAEEARALFAALARESAGAYGMLARFHEAALTLDAGDRAGAAAAFRALAGDDAVDRPMRDLAVVLAALAAVDGADGAMPGIEALAAAGSPWRFTAAELLGLAARRGGRIDEARARFQSIVDDAQAPADMRARASRVLAMLGRP